MDQCVRPTENPIMELNDTGKMIEKWLTTVPDHFIGSSLDIYQIMPNHIYVTRSGATVKTYLDGSLSLTYSSCNAGSMTASLNFLFSDKEANSSYLLGILGKD